MFVCVCVCVCALMRLVACSLHVVSACWFTCVFRRVGCLAARSFLRLFDCLFVGVYVCVSVCLLACLLVGLFRCAVFVRLRVCVFV